MPSHTGIHRQDVRPGLSKGAGQRPIHKGRPCCASLPDTTPKRWPAFGSPGEQTDHLPKGAALPAQVDNTGEKATCSSASPRGTGWLIRYYRGIPLHGHQQVGKNRAWSLGFQPEGDLLQLGTLGHHRSPSRNYVQLHMEVRRQLDPEGPGTGVVTQRAQAAVCLLLGGRPTPFKPFITTTSDLFEAAV